MIRVVEHNPDWDRMFQLEAGRIVAALREVAVKVHHIGSTAIRDTKAKPVIDILLEVTSLEALDSNEHLLVKRGYEAMREFGIQGRRYFRLDDAAGQRTHQVHAFATGTHNVIRHLAFRDYMQAHPQLALAYSSLKERLAVAYPGDRAAYNAGKHPFIKEHEQLALLWALARALP